MDIADRFERGLHFVGYWHTHPERNPKLSGIDQRALRQNLLDGGLAISKMIAVVVGSDTSENSICVCLVGPDLPVQLEQGRCVV